MTLDDVTLGTLLVAAPSEDVDPTFGSTVILIVDREPHWTITGLGAQPSSGYACHRSGGQGGAVPARFHVVGVLGGPVGTDPVQSWGSWRPSPTSTGSTSTRSIAARSHSPGIGLIALGEHHEPFEGRIGRARLYVGLCVWAAIMLEREIDRKRLVGHARHHRRRLHPRSRCTVEASAGACTASPAAWAGPRLPRPLDDT